VLAQHGTRATFFVLGWVAERHPALVREILAAGHEIASHGYDHRPVYRQTRAEFEADVARSLTAIRTAAESDGAGGTPLVVGYRAPAFSFTRDTPWALGVLREHALRYDSSILPLAQKGGRWRAALRGGKSYGIGAASRFAARVDGGLWEFPVSTVRVAGRTFPVGGGGYFRLLPLWLTRLAIRRINAEGHPAVLYLHPWELDRPGPEAGALPRLARFRHGVNRHRTEPRLHALLRTVPFGPLRDVFAAQLALR
jgi:polysaccharide deacetylase family protein (PEP-CTERM system associated)